MRYKGTVIELGQGGRCAFIGRETVTKPSGQPVTLETEKDIFVHNDDLRIKGYDFLFEIGQELVFETMPDSKRKGALRAYSAYITDDHPIEDGITLGFPERSVGHPMVPITWCLSPVTFARMKENPGRTWAIMFRARELEDGNQEGFNRARSFHRDIIGLESIAAGRTYLSFPAPGEWEIVAYLISTPAGHNTRNMLDSLRSDTTRIWDHNGDEVRLLTKGDTSETAATGHARASVPAEIFARPLPHWVRSWLSYFSSKPVDQCAARRTVALAFTLGLVWYLLWEFGKRLYTSLLGLGHLVFGFNPLTIWKLTFAKRLSAPTPFDFWGSHEAKVLPWLKGWGKLLHPFLILVYVSVAVTSWYFPDQMLGLLGGLGKVLVVIVLVFAVLFAIALIQVEREQRAKEREEAGPPTPALEEIRLASRRLELVGTYALCGVTPPAAPPPESISLKWDRIKRSVCRNYASG